MYSIIKRSLQLDRYFLKIDLPFSEKIEFLLKKYLLLVRNFLIGFEPAKSFVNIWGKHYFFDDKFGLSFLQSVYVDNSFLKKCIPENAIIIDAGANIGQFRFFCEHFLKAKKVYSFEPVKKTFEILKLNFPENIYNYAVSGQKELDIYVHSVSSMSSIIPHKNIEKIERVRGLELNDFYEIKEDYIDLFKIDTEGSEYDVIQSSQNLLKKSKHILVEISLTRNALADFTEIITSLKLIMPKIKLAVVGRLYKNKNVPVAMDFLFKNE